MADWTSLLGLPLDMALPIARAWGCEPRVLVTRAPNRRGEADPAARDGTLRVIRAREGELTVSAFRDGAPRTE